MVNLQSWKARCDYPVIFSNGTFELDRTQLTEMATYEDYDEDETEFLMSMGYEKINATMR